MRNIIIPFLFVCSISFGQMFSAQNAESGFVITMTKTTSAEYNNIALILDGIGNVNIDWGDGNVETKTLSSSIFYHTYTLFNNITVKIYHYNNISYLFCNYNQLTSLNVSGATALQIIYCNSNQLTSLNVSGATALQIIDCSSNQLTSLNVSGATALQIIDCNSNQLTSLNVSGAIALYYLDCYLNQLTSLNVSGAIALKYFNCNTNLLNQTNVDAVINAIYNNSINDGTLQILNNVAPSATGLSQINTLKTTRGWTITHD